MSQVFILYFIRAAFLTVATKRPPGFGGFHSLTLLSITHPGFVTSKRSAYRLFYGNLEHLSGNSTLEKIKMMSEKVYIELF